MRIFLVEDDLQQAQQLIVALEGRGHVVDHAASGFEALGKVHGGPWDVMIFDRMLPEMDGLTVIEQMRQDGNHTPVLILSALGQVDDRVLGLRSGGDDYLSKPYAFEELLARIEILAARAKTDPQATSLKVADLVLSRLDQQVARGGAEIVLQPKEYKLLEYLMQNVGRVVTRTLLLQHVWNLNFDPQTNVVDVHVSRLRSKIDKGRQVPLLRTVRGKGYILEDPSAENDT